jgi:hypothetical protein
MRRLYYSTLDLAPKAIWSLDLDPDIETWVFHGLTFIAEVDEGRQAICLKGKGLRPRREARMNARSVGCCISQNVSDFLRRICTVSES